MINRFVKTLKDDLGLLTYVNSADHIEGVKLGAHNITALGDGVTNIEGDELIVTVIRIEEEITLKNLTNQRLVKNGNKFKVDKRFPKIYLNYYLLFTAVSQYDKAVATIDRLIKFFQLHKKIEFISDGDQLELNLELFSPNFEQLNNIWGMCGGKHLPNVIYKARVSELENDEEKLKPIISTITSEQQHYE